MSRVWFALVVVCAVSLRAGVADTPPAGSIQLAQAPAEPAIRPLAAGEDAAKLKSGGAVVLGNHVLSASAAKALRSASPVLQKSLDQVETGNWGPITEQNARLTARQAMPGYVNEANQYYDGTRVRGIGVVAGRQKDKSDLELGDDLLGSAILSIKFVSPWNVKFDEGQIEGINKRIAKRLATQRGGEAPK